MRKVKVSDVLTRRAPGAPAHPGSPPISRPLAPLLSRARRPAAGRAAVLPAHRLPRSRFRLLLPLALLAMLGGSLGMTLLAPQTGSGPGGSQHLDRIDAMAAALGLGIDQVSVTGQRYALDSDILDALELPRARSFASFDTAAARRRIEELPWIETADIARIFPGQLAVTVKERRPYAIWRRRDHSVLVDVGGRVLAPVRPELTAGLARIAGEGAATEAATLHATLARYPGVRDRLIEAERIGGRRWTLRLTGNVTLKLPADREALVLESLDGAGGLARLLTVSNRVIDLRAPGRVAVRSLQPGAIVDAPERVGLIRE